MNKPCDFKYVPRPLWCAVKDSLGSMGSSPRLQHSAKCQVSWKPELGQETDSPSREMKPEARHWAASAAYSFCGNSEARVIFAESGSEGGFALHRRQI